MLVINPDKRITVEEALMHPYFEDIREPDYEFVCDRKFDLGIDEKTLTKEELRVRLDCYGLINRMCFYRLVKVIEEYIFVCCE